MRIQIGIFAMLVLLTATAFVPTAQAVERTWNLTDASTSSIDVFVMNASGAAVNETTIDLSSAITWVSNEPTDVALGISGNWTLVFNFVGASLDATYDFRLGTWTESGFVVDSSETLLAPDSVGGNTYTVNEAMNAMPGEHLAFQLQMNTGTAGIRVGGTDPVSSITSPDADPNFPVPELASVLLVAAGLVVIAGVVYTKKRNQA